MEYRSEPSNREKERRMSDPDRGLMSQHSAILEQLANNTQAQAPEGYELPINSVALDGLFTFFLRFPSFFGEARQHVKPDYFNQQGESVYAVLWQTLLRVHERDRAFSEFTVRMAFNEEAQPARHDADHGGRRNAYLEPGDGADQLRLPSPG